MTNKPEQITFLERNKLIAVFEGYKFNDPKHQHFNVTKPAETEWYFAAWVSSDLDQHVMLNFNYHTDWNLLMPVVEKIEDLSNDVEIKTGSTCIYSAETNVDIEAAGDTKIESTYLAVVEFIKWYNEQSKTTTP